MSLKEVGKIIDSRAEANVDWEIPNYSSLSEATASCIKSPHFHFLNTKWCIRIYPNGKRGSNTENTVGWIGMHLEVLFPISTYAVTFTLGIKNLQTDICNGPAKCTFSSDLKCYGFSKCYLSTDLLRLIKEWSPQDNLVICLAICSEASENTSFIADAASQTSLNNTSHLWRDLEDLLQSGRNSNITIDVRGHIFKVHRLILEARSPVFAAMFEHDTKEIEKILKITDCDPEPFQHFLKYMYTGKIETMPWSHAIELFEISDKYSMKDLKEQCAEFMADNLTVENVCDVLVVADALNEKQLKKSAAECIAKNIKTIKSTDEWRSLLDENPSLACEILLKFVPGDDNLE